ncbi:MAG: hypothetical protein ACREFZ_04720, partial [Acetobacteraceae bacterium]
VGTELSRAGEKHRALHARGEAMVRKAGENGRAKGAVHTAARDEESMLQSVESATSAWLDQMTAMRRVEAEFAARLVRCRTASEAISVCTEWLAKRVDSLVAVQHHLIDLWLESQAGRPERWTIQEPPSELRHVRAKDPASP